LSGRLRDAAYHCYIVADLTESLVGEIWNFNLKETPDREGRFGYIADGTAYVEIIPYGKLLRDAKLRQGIFFQKLGLTNFDPEIPGSVPKAINEELEDAQAGSGEPEDDC
jgi:hypothetical protein